MSQAPRINYYTTCPWCGANNARDPAGRPLFCWRCHHRPDVPKAGCTCPACVPQGQLDMFQTLNLPIKGREH